MSEPSVLIINTDGAARGNPGPSAFAYIITQGGRPVAREKGCLGHMTNNQAEYTALVRALEHAARLGTQHRVVIRSDSELLVKQMRGEYRVKDSDLRVLYDQARELSRRFAGVTFNHIPRAENSETDRLCNEALDGVRESRATPPRPKKGAAHPPDGKQEAAREQAVECLRAAASAWSVGNPNDPSPEVVWEQIWSILEEEGVLRRPRPL